MKVEIPKDWCIAAAQREGDSEVGVGRLAMTPAFITPKADGPMLVMSNGQVHYLTFIERVLWVLGFTTPDKLEAKHRY